MLVFNRPAETRLVFETIRKAAPAYLYIAADGARRDKAGEQQLCDKVRTIVQDVDWACEVKTLFRTENIGCRQAVSEAITWFFSFVEEGIILEDDCLPDHSFFPYCQELLEKYKYNDKIMTIGGTNLGYHIPGNESIGFTKFMNMWGWATWRRSVHLVDYNMPLWKALTFKQLFLHRKLQNNLFDIDYNWIKYWSGYFRNTADGKIDTWDYQWIFTELYYNKLSVFPCQNLVKNIGFSNNATHTIHEYHPVQDLALSSLNFPIRFPETIEADQVYEDNYVKKLWFFYKKESLYSITRSRVLNSSFLRKLLQK